MARLITESQKTASRANGRKSRGPVTEEGKRISARNATKHDLLANCLTVDPESREHFDALLNSLTATFDPQDAAEHMHVESVASARWHLTRIWSSQTAALNEEIRRQAPGMTDQDPATRVMLAMRALEKNDSTTQRTLSLDEHRYECQQRLSLHSLDRLKQRKTPKIPGLPQRTWEFNEKKELSSIPEPGKARNEPEPEAIKPEPEAIKPEPEHNEPALE